MRRIKFDNETIEAIRQFIRGGHTVDEACNQFTLKYDTLRRVMRENGIDAFYVDKRNKIANKPVDLDTKSKICGLFLYTDHTLNDICKQSKVSYFDLQQVLNEKFSQKQQDDRKSRLYRKSKLGDKNPMKNCKGENHHGYKGIISDGNGYQQCLKPDWYTGRVGSEHVFYHHVVVCQALGLSEIPKGFCVHHIDGNKSNNDISNLSLMTISAHSKLHSIQKNLCKVQRLFENEVGSNSETPNNDRQI